MVEYDGIPGPRRSGLGFGFSLSCPSPRPRPRRQRPWHGRSREGRHLWRGGAPAWTDERPLNLQRRCGAGATSLGRPCPLSSGGAGGAPSPPPRGGSGGEHLHQVKWLLLFFID